jgi:hypothetical protein
LLLNERKKPRAFQVKLAAKLQPRRGGFWHFPQSELYAHPGGRLDRIHRGRRLDHGRHRQGHRLALVYLANTMIVC